MPHENQIPDHQLAGIFPLLEGVHFRDLVEDIRVHGLREPIVLFEGAVLDGRNRYRACRAAQVDARFRTYDGHDALAFVVSANLHRRHLDASQRALIAAEIAEWRIGKVGRPLKAGRRDRGGRLLPPLKNPSEKRTGRPALDRQSTPGPNKISAEQAGELLNVSGSSVRHAQAVLKNGVPELVEAVRAGDTTASTAYELALLPREQQKSILRSTAPRKVATIGRTIRAERLDDRRASRAASNASEPAVFDHLKIGDGRSIGNVRVGEARRLADSLERVVNVLRRVLSSAANLDHGARIRDAISARMLSDFIAAVDSAASEADRA